MLRAMLLRVVVLGCAGLLGCAYGEVRQVVRAQFAAELNCPEVLIQKRDVWYMYDSPDQYKVSGCGVMRTYTCPADEDGLVSYDEPACTWVAGDADAPAAPKPMVLEDDPLAEPEPLQDEPTDAEPEPAHKKPEAKEHKPEPKPAEAKPEPQPEVEKPDATPEGAKPEAKPEPKPAKAKGGLKAGVKIGGSGKKAK
jgi:hypothetical protein